VLPSSKSIATCKPKGSPNVRPPTGFRFPTPHCKRGAPGKIGLMPVLRIGSLKGILPRRCHRSPLARLRGRLRLSAAWTGRAGWVTLRTHGFPGSRASGRPVGRSWRGAADVPCEAVRHDLAPTILTARPRGDRGRGTGGVPSRGERQLAAPHPPWDWRFATLPARLPALIGYLGRHLGTLLQRWAAPGHAAAVDSMPLCANGGVWPKKHRLAGEVSQTSIDTEAAWSQSRYHGWWYGGKLHLAMVRSLLW
jgi:hypothetical protein